MKIISRERDYYDYLSKIYGEDEKVVLKREFDKHGEEWFFNGLIYSHQIASRENSNFEEIIVNQNISAEYSSGRGSYLSMIMRNRDRKRISRVFFILVGEKVYARFSVEEDEKKETTMFDLSSEEGIHDFVEKLLSKDVVYGFIKKNFENELKIFTGSGEGKDLRLKLMKARNSPIIAISDIKRKDVATCFTVFNYDFLLKDYGINEFISPDDIYTHLVNFISFEMNAGLNEPPVEVTNTDKIVKAGFDLKKSFRHRK